jgi:hypothetical protein
MRKLSRRHTENLKNKSALYSNLEEAIVVERNGNNEI